MKVKLNNGTELTVIVVNGNQRVFQGMNRETLEFQFGKTIPQTIVDLNTLFSNITNTSQITISDDNGVVQSIQSNFTMKVQVGVISVEVTPATDTNPAVMEERYSVVMAQKTYAEIQQESLQETVDMLVLESLGV